MAGQLKPYTKDWTERGQAIEWIKRGHFERSAATIDRHREKMRHLMTVTQIQNLGSVLDQTPDRLKSDRLMGAIIAARTAVGE